MANIITGNKLVDESIIWYRCREGYAKVLQEYKKRVYISVERYNTALNVTRYQIDEEMPDFMNMFIVCINLVFVGKEMEHKIITGIYSLYSRPIILTDLDVYRQVVPFTVRNYILKRISLETEKKRLIPYVQLNGTIISIPLLECL